MTDPDPTRSRWVTQFEAILTSSLTEQSNYDFKIGTIRLDGSNTVDEASISRILENLVGMANLGKGRRGYIVIGVADVKADAIRVRDLYGVEPATFGGFYITGIDHEVGIVAADLDNYLQSIISKVRESDLSQPLKDYVCRHVRLSSYFGRSVLILESKGGDDPSNKGGRYFVREGNSLKEIPPSDLVSFIRHYQ